MCEKEEDNHDLHRRVKLKTAVTSGKTLKKILELEFIKQANRMSSGFWKMRNWTLWRGQPPPN
jgi:hypothetical protein